MFQQKSYTRLTLALDIVRRLTDGPCAGYHELGIVKHQIDLYDTIRIEKSRTRRIICDNPAVPCDQSNICWKAAQMLKDRFGVSGEVAITIYKRIPVMGGLAGGSADAAAVLDVLNGMWGLELGRKELVGLARELGMDVPYYFFGATAFDTEVGEEPVPIPTTLAFEFVLVIPRQGVSTAGAYTNIDYSKVAKDRRRTEILIDALGHGDRDAVIGAVHNDFELSVFRIYPRFARIKQALFDAGAEAAFMTGSGSTIVGIARNYTESRRVGDVLEGVDGVGRVLCCRTYVPQ